MADILLSSQILDRRNRADDDEEDDDKVVRQPAERSQSSGDTGDAPGSLAQRNRQRMIEEGIALPEDDPNAQLDDANTHGIEQLDRASLNALSGEPEDNAAPAVFETRAQAMAKRAAAREPDPEDPNNEIYSAEEVAKDSALGYAAGGARSVGNLVGGVGAGIDAALNSDDKLKILNSAHGQDAPPELVHTVKQDGFFSGDLRVYEDRRPYAKGFSNETAWEWALVKNGSRREIRRVRANPFNDDGQLIDRDRQRRLLIDNATPEQFVPIEDVQDDLVPFESDLIPIFKRGVPTQTFLQNMEFTLKDYAAGFSALQSPELKAIQSKIDAYVDAQDTVGGKFKAGVIGTLSEPKALAPLISETLGQLTVQAAAGASTKLITGGAKGLATTASVVAGGLDAGGAAADSTFEEMMSLEPAFISASERYVELVNNVGLSDEQARIRLAYEVSNNARWAAAAVTAFFGALPASGRVERFLAGNRLGGAASVASRGARIAKTTAVETVTEVTEAELAAGYQGFLVNSFDSNRDIFRESGKSGRDAVAGGLVGFTSETGNQLLGAMIDGSPPPEPDPDANPDANPDADSGNGPESGNESGNDSDDGGNDDPDGDPDADSSESNRRRTTEEVIEQGGRRTPEEIQAEREALADEDRSNEIDPVDGEARGSDPNDDIDEDADLWFEDENGEKYRENPDGSRRYFGPEDQAKIDERKRTKEKERKKAEKKATKKARAKAEARKKAKKAEKKARARAEAQNLRDDEDYGYDDPTESDDFVDNLDREFNPEEFADDYAQELDDDADYDDDVDEGDADLTGNWDDYQRELAARFNNETDSDTDQTNEEAESQTANETEQSNEVDSDERSERSVDGPEVTEGENSDIGQQENDSGTRNEQQPESAQRNDQRQESEERTEGQSRPEVNQPSPDADASGDTTQRRTPSSDTNANDGGSSSQPRSNKPRVKLKRQPKQRNRRAQPAPKLSARQTKRKAKARAQLDTMAANSNGRIEVHDSVDTLPDHIRDNVEQGTAQNITTDALYDPNTGKIHVLGNQILSPRQAKAIVAHETIHAGLVELFGSSKAAVDYLHNMYDGDPDMQVTLDRLAQKSDIDLAAYDSRYGSDGMPLSVFIEEILAHTREKQVSSPIKKFIDDIIQTLQDMGILKKNNAERDLLNLIKDAERAFYNSVENQSRIETEGYKPSEFLPIRYSLKASSDQIGMYSGLHEAALNLKQRKGSPDQMLAMLKKQPGVKVEELEWTGVQGYLELLGENGTKSITREQIADFAYEHGIQVKDTLAKDTRNTADADRINWSEPREFVTGTDREAVRDGLREEYDAGHPNPEIYNARDLIWDAVTDKPQILIDTIMRGRIRGNTLYNLKQTMKGKMLFDTIYDPDRMSETSASDIQDLRDMVDTLDDDPYVKEQLNDAISASVYLADGDVTGAMNELAGKQDIYGKYPEMLFKAWAPNLLENTTVRNEYFKAIDEEIANGYGMETQITIRDRTFGHEITHEEKTGNYTVVLDAPYSIAATVHSTLDDAKNYVREMVIKEDVDDTSNTRYRPHVASGNWTSYQEHVISLPSINNNASESTFLNVVEHFPGHMNVAFVLTTDRQVSVKDGDSQMTLRPHFIEELQSDLHSVANRKFEYDDRKFGYAGTESETKYSSPNAPFKGDAWIKLAFTRSVLQAIESGQQYIAWKSAESHLKNGADSKSKGKFEHIYNKVVPRIAKKVFNADPVKTTDGDWVISIPSNERSRIVENGQPLFSQRRAPTDLYNPDNRIDTREFADRTWKDSKFGYLVDTVGRLFVDMYTAIGRVENSQRRDGHTVDSDNSIRDAFQRIPGKTAARLDAVQNVYVKGLANLLHSKGLTPAHLSAYVYAIHATERNRVLRAKYNLADTVNPSGMSDKEASDIIKFLTDEGSIQPLEDVRKLVEQARKELIQTATDAGLINELLADELNSAYKYYVPLKGFAPTMREDGTVVEAENKYSSPYGPNGTITNSEFKKAWGRNSKAFDPVATLISDLAQMHMRAEKNIAMHSVLDFALEFPNKKRWNVYTNKNAKIVPDPRKQVDASTGKKREGVLMRRATPAEMAAGMIGVKRDGKQYYIDISDTQFKDNVINSDADKVVGIHRVPGTYNRFQSYVLTSLNYAFGIKNVIMDAQTTPLKISAETTRADGMLVKTDDDGNVVLPKGVIRRAAKLSGPAYRSMYRSISGKTPRPGNELDAAAYKMAQEGGRVGFYQTQNAEDIAAEIEKAMKKLNRSALKRNTIAPFAGLKDLIDTTNNATENAYRLAVFVAITEQKNPDGTRMYSDKVAADMARRLTVDFNQTGKKGKRLSAWYLFGNASIQGLVNNFRIYGGRAHGTHWARLTGPQKFAVGFTIASALYANVMRRTLGEDEDGEDKWDKLPLWQKSTSLIFPNFFTDDDTDTMFFPVTHGLNVFLSLGYAVEHIMHHGISRAGEGATLMAHILMRTAVPINVETSADMTANTLKTASPTLGQPLLELGLNQNHFGGRIYDEVFPGQPEVADSSLGRETTPEFYHQIAQGLNKASGGTEYSKGLIDVHPETLQYGVDVGTGGVGTMFDQFIAEPLDVLSGQNWEPDNYPIIGSFISSNRGYIDVQKFYDRSDKILVLNKEIRDYRAVGDTEAVENAEKKLGKYAAIVSDALVTRKELAQFRKERDRDRVDTNISEAERDARIKQHEKNIASKAMQWNSKWLDIKYPNRHR